MSEFDHRRVGRDPGKTSSNEIVVINISRSYLESGQAGFVICILRADGWVGLCLICAFYLLCFFVDDGMDLSFLGMLSFHIPCSSLTDILRTVEGLTRIRHSEAILTMNHRLCHCEMDQTWRSPWTALQPCLGEGSIQCCAFFLKHMQCRKRNGSKNSRSLRVSNAPVAAKNREQQHRPTKPRP